MHNTLHIRISGNRGAGKTQLLREIGAHLQSLGLDVTATDEGCHMPLSPIGATINEFEPRRVVIEAGVRRAPRFNDGGFRELVTTLRDVANTYAGTGQLRARIARALREAEARAGA